MWIVINQNTKKVAETIFLQTREYRNLQPNQILINPVKPWATWDGKLKLNLKALTQ